jgi:hypothetical protein
MTGAERSWASHFEVIDVIRYSPGIKSAGIEAGTCGTVLGIDTSASTRPPTYSPSRDPPVNCSATIRAA